MAENTDSLDQATKYESVLNHCLQKLGVDNKWWHKSSAFTAAIDYARKSGNLNVKNELTVQGKQLAAMKISN